MRPYSLLRSARRSQTRADALVTRQEDRWKQKVTELQITFASVKAGLSGEERCNQQVKDEVRRLKQENCKIREAIKKDIDCMKHERYDMVHLPH